MADMIIKVHYKAGHFYKEPWEKTTFFCLACGTQSVWAKRDGGDYYAGENYICSACGADWDLPKEPDDKVDYLKEQRLNGLRDNQQSK
jgi:predicted RNA-binding Zn-ribbon protein involved in translation (DUF1610 family)